MIIGTHHDNTTNSMNANNTMTDDNDYHVNIMCIKQHVITNMSPKLRWLRQPPQHYITQQCTSNTNTKQYYYVQLRIHVYRYLYTSSANIPQYSILHDTIPQILCAVHCTLCTIHHTLHTAYHIIKLLYVHIYIYICVEKYLTYMYTIHSCISICRNI